MSSAVSMCGHAGYRHCRTFEGRSGFTTSMQQLQLINCEHGPEFHVHMPIIHAYPTMSAAMVLTCCSRKSSRLLTCSAMAKLAPIAARPNGTMVLH